jgi:aspartate-semialdehyde dehydrogenase
MKINIAIVGSTGNVGRKTVEALERRKFPVNNLYLLSSKRSAGSFIKFRNKKIRVENLENFDFKKAHITFFCAGSKLAKILAPKIAKYSTVIEHSKHFRMLKDIPLVIPEVNEYALKNYKKKNIISNPNCSTTQLVLALKPLHDKFKVTRVVTSTYQSVSGAGKASMDELISQTKNYLAKEGSTKEEWKMENETKKILDKNIKVTATCVRVPVLISHSESVNIELKKRFNIKQIRSILSKAPGCKVIDEHKNGGYATPAECAGSFSTYISRIRKDPTRNAINLWIVSDNLLKGAAFNGVQIAEVLVKKYIKNN